MTTASRRAEAAGRRGPILRRAIGGRRPGPGPAGEGGLPATADRSARARVELRRPCCARRSRRTSPSRYSAGSTRWASSTTPRSPRCGYVPGTPTRGWAARAGRGAAPQGRGRRRRGRPRWPRGRRREEERARQLVRKRFGTRRRRQALKVRKLVGMLARGLRRRPGVPGGAGRAARRRGGDLRCWTSRFDRGRVCLGSGRSGYSSMRCQVHRLAAWRSIPGRLVVAGPRGRSLSSSSSFGLVVVVRWWVLVVGAE